MIDIRDSRHCPSMEELENYVRTPLFQQFCGEMQDAYQANVKLEFSGCAWEHGWNVKFRKSGKTLCTLYPRENFFTVLVVIGSKEKEAAESLLPECAGVIQEIYRQTKEGNGQKWLMIDLEDAGKVYDDVKRLIRLRYPFKKEKAQ